MIQSVLNSHIHIFVGLFWDGMHKNVAKPTFNLLLLKGCTSSTQKYILFLLNINFMCFSSTTYDFIKTSRPKELQANCIQNTSGKYLDLHTVYFSRVNYLNICGKNSHRPLTLFWTLIYQFPDLFVDLASACYPAFNINTFSRLAQDRSAAMLSVMTTSIRGLFHWVMLKSYLHLTVQTNSFFSFPLK